MQKRKEMCIRDRFEGIEPDPSVETVMKGAQAMLEFQPDWIVAMGGGSPIDAAKAMWIKYEYPDITFEEMCKVFGIPALRKKAHFLSLIHILRRRESEKRGRRGDVEQNGTGAGGGRKLSSDRCV